jgi:type I restriction enzyme S subunit
MSDKKARVPQIRFVGFTGDWEERKLGDLGSVVMNRRIYKEQTSDNGDVPFYKIGTFGSEPDAFISRELFEEYKAKYPYPKIGDVLISASGSIGKTVVYTGKDEYFQDSNIVWLQHDNRLLNSFLKQFYTVVEWSGLEGSTIKRLYNKNILDTPISLPKPEEQKKVGQFFIEFDNLLTLQQHQLDQLASVKKTMLEKMFPKDGANVPEIRFAGFTGAWEERKLSAMTDYKNGKGHEDRQSDNGKYELVNLNSISIDGGLKHSGKFVDETEDTLVENDLVMVLSDVGHGDLLGRVALIPENDRFVLNQRVALLRPNNTVDPQFLFSHINAHQQYFKTQGAGMSQLNISKGSVEGFTSCVPHKEEQIKIGELFSNLDNLLTLHQRQLNALKTLKQSLLQHLFI